MYNFLLLFQIRSELRNYMQEARVKESRRYCTKSESRVQQEQFDLAKLPSQRDFPPAVVSHPKQECTRLCCLIRGCPTCSHSGPPRVPSEQSLLCAPAPREPWCGAGPELLGHSPWVTAHTGVTSLQNTAHPTQWPNPRHFLPWVWQRANHNKISYEISAACILPTAGTNEGIIQGFKVGWRSTHRGACFNYQIVNFFPIRTMAENMLDER